MQPRLATSVKWTPFPAEFLEKIEEVLNNGFPLEAKRGRFLAEGRIYPNEILMRIGYLENGRLRQVNFEASVEHATKPEESAFPLIYTGLDAIGALFEQYFQADEDEVDWPVTWQAFEFDQRKLWIQFSSVNTSLEAEADRLLAAADQPGHDLDALVHEADTNLMNDGDALSHAVIDNDLAFEIQKKIRKGEHELN